VWAVWEDATESLGHGMILIKGHGKFRELTASVMEGRGDTFGVAAIKYSSLQWANAVGSLVQQQFPDLRTNYCRNGQIVTVGTDQGYVIFNPSLQFLFAIRTSTEGGSILPYCLGADQAENRADRAEQALATQRDRVEGLLAQLATAAADAKAANDRA